ncbi:MAG: AAA family ATPase [Candidatus Peribacteraceae bacterium]
MRIACLTIRNYLGITEAKITPKGKVTVLAGDNRQGKSSVLKAIPACFQGMTPAMIHNGAERAEIAIELGDLVVTRVQTLLNQSVTVKDVKGRVQTAPQKFLNGLFGGFAFNPMAFLLASDKEQRSILLQAMAVTVTKEEVEAAASTGESKEMIPLPASGPALEMYADAHRHFYSARTDVNRTLKQKKIAAAEVLKKLPEGYKPVEGIEEKAKANRQLISGIQATLSGLQAEKMAAERAKETRKKTEERIRNNQGILARTKESLAKEQFPDMDLLTKKVEEARLALRAAEEALQSGRAIVANIDRLTESVSNMERDIRQDQETLAALPGAFDESLLDAEAKTLDELLTESATIEAERSRQRIWNEYAILRDDATEAETESARLSALCDRFGNELPAQAVREAKLPIPGLALSGEKITVDGKPLDDLSTAEQMGVTMAIAKALAGELKVVCIDGAERLDEKTRAEFIRQAEGDEFYYFVTRVGAPQAGEIEIREGKVAVNG